LIYLTLKYNKTINKNTINIILQENNLNNN